MNKSLIPLLLNIPLGNLGSSGTVDGLISVPVLSLSSRYNLLSMKVMNGAALAVDPAAYVNLSLRKTGEGTALAYISTDETALEANEGAEFSRVGDFGVLEAGSSYYLDLYEEHVELDPPTALTNGVLVLELEKL